MPLQRYYDILTVFTSIDMLITFVIPSVLIVTFNAKIIVKLRHYQEQNALKLKRMRAQVSSVMVSSLQLYSYFTINISLELRCFSQPSRSNGVLESFDTR